MKYFRRRNVLAVLSALMCLQGAGAVRAAAVTSVETGGGVSVDVRAPVEQGSFTDENGTTYEWAGYSDGTAAVTDYVFSEEEPVIAVPDSLGGYRVTRLTGSVRGKTIQELVIPEGVTFLGERVFCDNEIRLLIYNLKPG